MKTALRLLDPRGQQHCDYVGKLTTTVTISQCLKGTENLAALESRNEADLTCSSRGCDLEPFMNPA